MIKIKSQTVSEKLETCNLFVFLFARNSTNESVMGTVTKSNFTD